jgi:hypothetical protein
MMSPYSRPRAFLPVFLAFPAVYSPAAWRFLWLNDNLRLMNRQNLKSRGYSSWLTGPRLVAPL